MKRAKRYLLLSGIAVLFLSACQSKQNNSVEVEPEAETEDDASEENETYENLNENLTGLIEGEYKELEVSAAVLERKAILSGSTIPLTVTVTNNGNKTIVYTLGSGSFETPEALIMDIPGLQPILPKDHLGIATADFRSKELMPGETIEYTLYIRAVEPSEQFNDFTYEMWKKEETYIADVDWPQLKKYYDAITEAETGSYEGSVYFLYYLPDEEQAVMLQNPTGYSKGVFTISVSD